MIRKETKLNLSLENDLTHIYLVQYRIKTEK